MNRLTQNFLKGLFLIVCISCTQTKSDLNLELNITGQNQIDYFDSSGDMLSIDKTNFNKKWKTKITNPNFANSKTKNIFSRIDNLNVSKIELLNNNHDTISKRYIISTHLIIDSIDTEGLGKLFGKDKFVLTIKGQSEHEITVISEKIDSSYFKLKSKFDVSLRDSLSDKITAQMINYIVEKSFLESYFGDINKKITEKF